MYSVVCAPDKFRGALTATDAATAMARGAAAAGWTALQHPMADGGEGTREVILASGDARELSVPALDAIGRTIDAPFLMGDDGTATVVAADVLGLAALHEHELNPLEATSRGLAEPILAARAAGARRILVFVGGVATIDGGLGLLAALGGVVHDVDGTPLLGAGRDLPLVHHLDLAAVRERLGDVELVVATDVDSPLHGVDGAAHVFGPQKGAGTADVLFLDDGLRKLAAHLGPVASRPGAGAAGGIGAALMALGASRVSGAEALLDITRFSDRLRSADLVVTGEGKVDRGTMAGKAVAAIIKAADAASVPCAVLGGTVTLDAATLYGLGTAGIFSIGRKPRPLARAMEQTASDLEWTTRSVCELAAAVSHKTSPAAHRVDDDAHRVMPPEGERATRTGDSQGRPAPVTREATEAI